MPMIDIPHPNKGMIGDTDYSEYRYHPRMVELYIITTYLNFVREYGTVKTEELFKAFCAITGVDSTKIIGIIRNVDRFSAQLKTMKDRYRQEVVFLGAIWGHHRMYIAKHHLHITHVTLYRFKDLLNPEKYVTQEWLDQLSNNVIICGIEGYKQEGIRFIDGFFNLVRIMGDVSVSKVRL
jgi:hypothetical protein